MSVILYSMYMFISCVFLRVSCVVSFILCVSVYTMMRPGWLQGDGRRDSAGAPVPGTRLEGEHSAVMLLCLFWTTWRVQQAGLSTQAFIFIFAFTAGYAALRSIYQVLFLHALLDVFVVFGVVKFYFVTTYTL